MRPEVAAGVQTRNVTIKDLAAALGLSITTISRALNGYSDVGDATRQRVTEAARELGYFPNRNAQRLVTRRTHNIAWVQPDNDRKFLDPHFAEVMAGVLRATRAAQYDIVLTSDTPEHELVTYQRYVLDNSVDGFILDLPREDDKRIAYLLEVGRPFVVHGREGRHAQYGWVDIDNYGDFYRLTRLLLANGHRRIAFINGDETFNFALYRRIAVQDAVADFGLPPDTVTVFNSTHPMGDFGFRLTSQALTDESLGAIIYSSILLAVEGYPALQAADRQGVAVATIDDGLQHLDLSRFAHSWTFCRSSLREAGIALIDELVRQCDRGQPPRGTLIASRLEIAAGLDPTSAGELLPAHRAGRIGSE